MLLEFDLAGAEWFVVAFLCRDENMIGVYKSGESPHIVTGSRLAGVSKDLVKADEALVGKHIDQDIIAQLRRDHLPDILNAVFLPRKLSIRQASKKANHGLNYDESYLMFALMNELENREAKTIVDRYKNVVYPQIPKWHKAIRKQITDTRTLTNCFGHKCYFMGALDNDTFKAAYSYLPQSTVTMITNRAMPKIMDDESEDFHHFHIMAQVHDSLLNQLLIRDYRAAARIAIKIGLDYMSPTLDYGEPFKLKVTMKAALKSWGKMQEVDGGIVDDVEIMARRIEEAVEKSAAEKLKKAA